MIDRLYKFLDSPAGDVLDGIIFLVIYALICILIPLTVIIGLCMYLI